MRRKLFTLAAGASAVMCLAIDAARSADGWAEFNLKSVLDHEVAVLEL